MQVKWKQHELIFAISIFLFFSAQELLAIISATGDATRIPREFAEKGVPYHFMLNALLPFALSHVVPFLVFLGINLWLLPRTLAHNKSILILPAAAILSWLILSLSFGFSFYLQNYYLSGTLPDGELKRWSVDNGLNHGGTLVIFYILYLAVRETMTAWLTKEADSKPFRIVVSNKITSITFLYFGLLIFFRAFNVFDDSIGIIYVFILAPAIIIMLLNIYGLFPYWHKKKVPFWSFAWKLLIAPLVLSLISWILFSAMTGRDQFFLLVALWGILVLTATPFSWLLFLQQSEKLLSLQLLRKDLEEKSADLAFLRSQINPHFLFNTLNTLYGTALQENASRTAEGVQRLGDMMRFLLHENHLDQIPVQRELAYLRDFINLQQLRIEKSPGITIETDMQSCTENHSIAPMLLIPFIENAFKHGIRLSAPSWVRARFHCDAHGIHLDVVNSLHATRAEDVREQHSGIGLENVKKRLRLIYPGKHSLYIQQDDTAFQVKLRISFN